MNYYMELYMKLYMKLSRAFKLLKNNLTVNSVV